MNKTLYIAIELVVKPDEQLPPTMTLVEETWQKLQKDFATLPITGSSQVITLNPMSVSVI